MCGTPEHVIRNRTSHTAAALEEDHAERKGRLSKYQIEPLDFGGLKTVPSTIAAAKFDWSISPSRIAKAAAYSHCSIRCRDLLAADSFRRVAEAMLRARAASRQIIWGMGGHVIKCGLAPVLLDLMGRGFATAFAMNGSAAIHDFEIAIAGWTSEDVEAVLPDGRFGSAEETGREMNVAHREGDRVGSGWGKRSACISSRYRRPECIRRAFFAGVLARRVPVTVHVAIGTDTPHTHPAADGGGDRLDHASRFSAFSDIVTGLA